MVGNPVDAGSNSNNNEIVDNLNNAIDSSYQHAVVTAEPVEITEESVDGLPESTVFVADRAGMITIQLSTDNEAGSDANNEKPQFSPRRKSQGNKNRATGSTTKLRHIEASTQFKNKQKSLKHNGTQ